MEPEIIYQDDNLIAVNKPPDLPVHGGDRVKGTTLTDWLLKKFPEIASVGDDPTARPGIVHRLDKNTSGVMIVARNQKTFKFLKTLFKTRQIEKTYHALLCGMPKTREGIIALPIGRLVKNPVRRGVEQGRVKIRGSREAITHYRVLKGNEDYALVELKPKTGRMHQLRVHMKALGHPVACDTVYGGKKVCCPEGAWRQLLHARSIAFSFPAHEVGEARPDGRPEGRRFFFEADYPEDFTLAVKKVL